MKRMYKILGFGLLGVVSFIFFFYLTFPFEIVREFVEKNVYSATGLSLQIGKISGRFPVGISAKSIQVKGAGAVKAQLSKASVQVSLLPLLWGRVSVSARVEDTTSGVLYIYLGFSLLDLLQGKGDPIPSVVEIESDHFQVDQFINMMLSDLAKSPSTDYLMKPVFDMLRVKGQLKANLDLSLVASDWSKSEGTMEIELIKGELTIADASLQLPNQTFKKALIKGSLAKGQLVIDPTSGILSESVLLALQGKVQLKPNLEQSILSLELAFELKEKLKDQFAWVLDAVVKKETNGKGKVAISGTLHDKNISPL
jgi:hypothetical protein